MWLSSQQKDCLSFQSQATCQNPVCFNERAANAPCGLICSVEIAAADYFSLAFTRRRWAPAKYAEYVEFENRVLEMRAPSDAQNHQNSLRADRKLSSAFLLRANERQGAVRELGHNYYTRAERSDYIARTRTKWSLLLQVCLPANNSHFNERTRFTTRCFTLKLINNLRRYGNYVFNSA